MADVHELKLEQWGFHEYVRKMYSIWTVDKIHYNLKPIIFFRMPGVSDLLLTFQRGEGKPKFQKLHKRGELHILFLSSLSPRISYHWLFGKMRAVGLAFRSDVSHLMDKSRLTWLIMFP